MASLTEVRLAIKARLETVRNLTAYAIEPGTPYCPAAWSVPVRVDYHADFDGDCTYTMGLTVAVLMSDIGQAQTALDDYLAPTGSKSIVALLEADPTLGGVVDNTTVVAMTAYGAREMGGKSVLTASFEVRIYA